MGSGASVESLSDDDLIKVASQIYQKSPGRFDFIVAKARIINKVNESKSNSEDLLEGLNEGFGQELLNTLNLVRQKPWEFLKCLESHLSTFEDNYIFTRTLPNGSAQRIQTREGKAAVVEAIDFLRSASSLPPLTWSNLLAKAAREHAQDIGSSGSTSHTGSDGSSSMQRVKRYALSSCVGENLDFGNSDPVEIVTSLIVDDDVSSRGHRKNILHPDFTSCGVALHSHKTCGVCCVMDYAGDVKALSELISSDCDVSIQGYMSEEFMKVVDSIPSSDNGQALIKELQPYLDNGAKIEVQFRPTEKSATFAIIEGDSTSTIQVKWKETF